MKEKLTGKSLLVQGSQAKSAGEVDSSRDVDTLEWQHAVTNIAQMTAKYNGLIGEGCEAVAEAQQ